MRARVAAAAPIGRVAEVLQSDRFSLARTITLAALGSASFFLLFGWDGVAPLLVAPAMVGVALGLASASRLEALVSALASAAVGSIAGILMYNPDFQSVAVNSMADWMNRDVALGVYTDLVVPVLRGSPVMLYGMVGKNPWPLIVIPALVMAASALAAVETHRSGTPRRLRMIAAYAVIAVLAGSLVFALGTRNSRSLEAIRAADNPTVGYASDPSLNAKTYFLMARGSPFYPAYVRAHELDSRHIVKVEKGKFVGGAASMMRQPAVFYLWQLLAPGGRVELVLWVAYMAAGLVLFGLFWGLSVALGYRALFVAFCAYPMLLMHAGGLNPLYPEWWALLALLAGFLAMVRGHFVAAGVFGLTAIVFRETFAVWLLALALSSAMFALRDRRVWRRVALYGGLLVGGGVAYLLHVAIGSRYVVSKAGGSLGAYLSSASSRDVAIRLLSPVSYLMYPYGSFRFSMLWFLPLGIIGLWVGLRRVPEARLAASLYALLFCGYLIAFGAPSQYWGQAVMPILVIGTAMLLASLDALSARSSWVMRLTPAESAATLASDRRSSQEAE